MGGLVAWNVDVEETEGALDRDGAWLFLDAEGGMFAKRSLMVDGCRAAAGCAAWNGLRGLVAEVAGGGDGILENAVRCASVVSPGVVADWKSSKSSSPGISDSRAANSSTALGEAVTALPFELDAAPGSSPKSKRSCSGSF